jgi:hypothetical protein
MVTIGSELFLFYFFPLRVSIHIMYGFPSLALRVPFCISYLQLLAVDGSNQTPRPFFFQLFTTIIGWYTPTSDSILYYAYLLLFVYLNVLVLD